MLISHSGAAPPQDPLRGPGERLLMSTKHMWPGWTNSHTLKYPREDEELVQRSVICGDPPECEVPPADGAPSLLPDIDLKVQLSAKTSGPDPAK